jgi:hypothetical protein
MTNRSLEGNCRLQKTEADLKGKKSKLMVTCLNTILPAKNDNGSPESKKGHLGTKTALILLYNVVISGLLLGEGGIEPQSVIHLEETLEPHKQFSPM